MRPDSRFRHKRNACGGHWFRKNCRSLCPCISGRFRTAFGGNNNLFEAAGGSIAAAALGTGPRQLDHSAAAQALEAIEVGEALVRLATLHGDAAERAGADRNGGILAHASEIAGRPAVAE